MTVERGARLGPYEILGVLGAGGMGEVYRARDERLGREVAVKVLPADSSADPDRLRRFEQEAKAAGALNHPNLVAVFDTGQHEGNPYVVFELLDGVTLRQAAGPRRPPRAQSRGLRGPDRAGPGRGPREGDRPPRPQAREPLRHQGRAGEDPGLRPGQAPAGARPARSSRRGRDGFHRDRGGRRPRHRRLHVARAGQGGSRRPSVRHLRLRVGALRDAVGPAAVCGRDRRRGDDGDPQGGPAGAGESGRSCRARAGGEALPREATRGALPVGAGHRLRPGGRLGGLICGSCCGRPWSGDEKAERTLGGSSGRRRRRAGRGLLLGPPARRPRRRPRRSSSSRSGAASSTRRASPRTATRSSTVPRGKGIRAGCSPRAWKAPNRVRSTCPRATSRPSPPSGELAMLTGRMYLTGNASAHAGPRPPRRRRAPRRGPERPRGRLGS